MLGDVFGPFFARRNIDSLAAAVQNLGLVDLRVDLDFVVVGRRCAARFWR